MSRYRTRVLRVLALSGCMAAGCLAWAVWWPDAHCSEPACVRQRFSLFIELDAFSGIPPIEWEQRIASNTVSLRQLFASGGVDVTLVRDQMALPYDPTAGKLDRADLYQYAKAWRTLRAPPAADAGMYALLAPGLVADNGVPLFGLMFDYSDREGFAVAPSETIVRFGRYEAAAIPALQMRTFAHELLHALNRSHIDASPNADGRLTVESPTRCISDDHGPDWRLLQQPLFELSLDTIGFFQSAAARDVLPGKGNTPYDLRRGSADECSQIRSKPAVQFSNSRWMFGLRRLRHLLSIPTAHAQDNDGAMESDASEAQAELRIQALPSAYPLGYPIAVRLIVKNLGARALPLRGRLLPGFGMVQVEVRKHGSDVWQPVSPLAWYEPASDDEAMLGPGEWTEETAPIYFGDSGWTFPSPGEYSIRARLQLGDDTELARSNNVEIHIEPPHSERDKEVLQALTTDGTHMNADLGKLLIFGGSIGSDQDTTPIERIVREFPDTALGSALRLALASHNLRPPIDPRTGKRPIPDVSEAAALLADTCTDSGVAALRRALIVRHADLFPRIDLAEQQEYEPWDGSGRSDTFLRTYADLSLASEGSIVNFCFDDATLTAAARKEVRRWGRELVAVNASRVMVIGHTDAAASCSYNDRLGLQRAEAVKRELTRSGLRASNIVTVSLGERRPVDFARTADADAANRRVEILVQKNIAERRQARFGNHPSRQIQTRCAR